MDGTGQDDLVLVGKVSKAHGIRGELKVYPYSGDPEGFAASYHRLFLAREDGGVPAQYLIERARIQGNQVLIQIENCSDRTTAQGFVGSRVCVLHEDLPELDDDEFYLQELLGKELVDSEGKVLGKTTRIVDGGGQNLLMILRDGKEYLIPVVGSFFVSIGSAQVVCDLPVGLLEIND